MIHAAMLSNLLSPNLFVSLQFYSIYSFYSKRVFRQRDRDAFIGI